jgi:hypothetical protein
MKQLMKLILFASAWFFGASVALAQDNPCLKINGDYTGACPSSTTQVDWWSLTTNRVEYQIVNAENTLDNVRHGARYKAFWLLGDGNFRYFDYGTLEQDLATYNQGYVYPAMGEYSPTVVLAERKSNTSPPRNPKRNVSVSNRDVNPGVADSFFVRIRGNQAMDIFNHDRNRPHYPTVFAISSLAADKLADSIFFFYNCEFKNGAYSSLKIHDKIDFVSFPNYLAGRTEPIEERTSTHPLGALTTSSGSLSSRFLNFLRVDIGLSANSPDFIEKRAQQRTNAAFRSPPANPFNELRFFPALLSTWSDRWIGTSGDTLLPVGHYLAVSVGSEPLPAQYVLKGETIPNPIYAEALRYFPNLNPANLQVAPQRYLRGMATREVEMVASIDPNGLQVLQVCPLGQNRYQVKIRMEVCNEGLMHEQNFGFSLKDHTGVIGEPDFIAGTVPNKLPSTAANQWNYKWNVFLDGLPLPDGVTAEAASEVLKTCDTLIFTVTTNWLGVQRLAKGQGLELCVQFSHAKEECNLNYKLNERELSPLTGYECGEMPPSCWLCCIPVYITLILAFIILALLIWIAWYLKRKLG